MWEAVKEKENKIEKRDVRERKSQNRVMIIKGSLNVKPNINEEQGSHA